MIEIIVILFLVIVLLAWAGNHPGSFFGTLAVLAVATVGGFLLLI